jgi:phage FluMu gp28-like protein
MRRRFEDRAIRIPALRDLREDLHAVQRNVSTGGAITYAAPRNADGHSDRAAALALCIRAASARVCSFLPVAFRDRVVDSCLAS